LQSNYQRKKNSVIQNGQEKQWKEGRGGIILRGIREKDNAKMAKIHKKNWEQ